MSGRLLPALAVTAAMAAAPALSSATPTDPLAVAADKNCSDFSNQAAAQTYFTSHGGSPTNNVDGLDADHDGVACESLPCPCTSSGGGGGGGGGGGTPTCGKERWPVKTLSDSRVGLVNFRPRTTTVDSLRSLSAPDVGFSTPRIRGSAEVRTYKLSARLIEFKREPDHDIHLVIADPSHLSHRMVVEFPDTICPGARSSIKKRSMAAARAAVVHRFGSPPSSHFERISGSVTITGVGFFDVLHGQTGHAPNGIELHPVLRFR